MPLRCQHLLSGEEVDLDLSSGDYYVFCPAKAPGSINLILLKLKGDSAGLMHSYQYSGDDSDLSELLQEAGLLPLEAYER